MPPLSAALHLLRGRWVALVTSTLVLMAAGGSVFLFPVYSKAIKTSLGYDYKALSVLAVCKNLGASFGFLPSLIYDFAPPWVVLASVAAMNLLGVLANIVPYLAVAGHIARHPLWLMGISIALGANSQSFAVTGALVSSVKNLPDHRGPVLSLLLAFAGLGGDILTQLGQASGGSALLLFMACLYLVLLPFACNSIRVIPAGPGPAGTGAARSEVERRGVVLFLLVSVSASACLLILHVVDLVAAAHLPGPAYYVTAIFVVVFLVISLLVVAVKQDSSSPATAATSGEAAAAGSSSSSSMHPTPPSSFRLERRSILQDVFAVEMMLIFVVTFAIGGGVQTPIDMIDQIGQSLQYKDGATSKLVSLVSLLDYAGRLVGGFGSEYMVARHKLPRPAALTVAFLLACFGHLFIALGVPSGLYHTSAIMGFSLGALWAVVFVTISEVFGTRHLAALYNLAVLPAAVGSYILNVQVTGRLYNREAQRQDHHTCIGIQCSRVSFFILLGVTLLGAVVSAVLALWVWPSYRRVPIGAAGVAPDTTDCSNRDREEDEAAV
ncbi:protein NUCLEAR FUSION DEFECTIVE 4-like [Miscanthus floridulus]|uniref:protein NUCLEAR FUSION DEFECTIVE 4-like n=1 Tax=Miscanthus floridulus TaxID=154761 RepID=UPI0034596613